MKLDAMKAAGLLPGAIVGAGDGESKGAAAPAVGGAMLYANKKKKPTPGAGAKSQEEVDAEAKEAAEAAAAAAAAKEEEEDDDGDDWDADGDDWEANLDKINIAAKVRVLILNPSLPRIDAICSRRVLLLSSGGCRWGRWWRRVPRTSWRSTTRRSRSA